MAAAAGAFAEKEKEADKLMKKAQKEISPSLFDFRLKPDWEQAAPSFEKAAMLYKQCKNIPKALEAYEQAATAQEKLGSLWHAGKHYEACADLCKQQQQIQRVMTFYQRASDAYCTAGKITAAAEAMTRGAKEIEDTDSDTAIKMLQEALELYETDGKEIMGADTYRATAATMIKAQRYGEAAELQMRFALACDRMGSHNSQCKAYLGALIIHLYNYDGLSAWHAFQDAMNVDAFSGSEEAFLADALFAAYRSGSEDEVKKMVTGKQAFRQLDSQIARLAIKLPGSEFKTVAKAIAEAMGADVGDDGEEGEEEEGVM